MKNEINVKNFIKILKDSIWEASDSSSYEKYFSQIENLLFGLDDYVIEDLASLEGLTDKSALDIFLRSKTPEEIDRRFYAIHCELRTWAYQRKKQAIEDFYNKKNVKKIIITICLVAFIVLAIIFAIFMSLGNVGIFDIGEKIGVIVAAIGFPFDVISFAAGMLYNLYSDKKRRKIIKTMGSIITDPENEDNQNAEREFLELYKKGYEKESEIKTAITLCGVPESYHKKNLRKARRIFRRLLVANPKDPNLYAGLLRVASKNFTKFQGRQIKKYIKAIYKYNEKNEQLIDDDCNKYIKAYDEHKTQMVAKQRQAEEAAIANGNIRQQRKIQRRKNRREFLNRALPKLQKIGMYTVLILPILLSATVIALIYCLPVKSFSDYTGWLFTIFYALDCLSFLCLIVLLIALCSDSVLGFVGSLALWTGACTGVSIYSILLPPFGWWKYLILSIAGVAWVGTIIYAFIVRKKISISCFLTVVIAGVCFGFALFGGMVEFDSFIEHTSDYYIENADGTYTYVIKDFDKVNLDIPSKYHGKLVTAVSKEDGLNSDKNLKTVSLPGTITKIEESIFNGCSNLESLTVPYIGYLDVHGVNDYEGEAETIRPLGYLFGVTEYEGGEAVEQCYGGKYISGDKIGEEGYFSKIFYIPRTLKTVTVLGGDICEGAFYNCEKIESIILPDSATAIGKEAFYNCTSLESITIPDNVTSIDRWAFLGCKNIKTATIPALAINSIPKDSLETVVITSGESIGENAFNNCTSLKNITIPDSVTSIGDYAFEDCSSLESANMGNGLTSIGNGAFEGCSSLKGITIPDSVTSIDSWAFAHCSSLESVVISNNVTSIDGALFLDCKNIKTATIPALAIDSIPKDSLETVVITSGESIDKEAFNNCTNLKNITIPNSVTSIGDYAFEDCSSLKSITIPDSVTSIGSAVFYGCNKLENLTVPYIGYLDVRGVNDYEGEAEAIMPLGYLFGAIDYEGGEAVEQYLGGKYISGDKTGEEGYFSKIFYIPRTLKTVTVLGGDICEGAFYNCEKIENIILPDSATAIGKEAFYNCTSLKGITIPDSVTSIGKEAFHNCGAVRKEEGISYVDKWVVDCDSTVIAADLVNAVGIADYAFAEKQITSLTLNEGLKYIGEGAFDSSRIQTIYLPESLLAIGASAFKNCELTSATFENVKDWYAGEGRI